MAGLNIEPIIITATGYMVMPLSPHRLPATLDGLDSVYDVYQDRVTKKPVSTTFEFFKRAAITCAYTYGDFIQWLRTHAIAAKISATQFDFILDTLRFIATGRRKMSLSNWVNVTKYVPNLQITESEHASRLKLLNDVIDKYSITSNPVPLWCAHESGLDDLIVTTAIMFAGIQLR